MRRLCNRWRLAMVYDLQGRQEEALAELDEALRIDPGHEESKKLRKELRQKK